jgi:hypothetical protein
MTDGDLTEARSTLPSGATIELMVEDTPGLFHNSVVTLAAK